MQTLVTSVYEPSVSDEPYETGEETTVYTFAELDESAKETAREWMREMEMNHFDPEMEQFETAAKILGITFATNTRKLRNGKTWEELDIAYSGFSSQGDGASFTGSYQFAPGCSEAIRAEFGTDTKLATIADELSALWVRLILKYGTPARTFDAKITRHSSQYSHANTMDASIYDSEGDELDTETCDEFRDLMRDFANWIYKSLEEEYDYRLSDEAIDETIEANEYEFDEDGARV